MTEDEAKAKWCPFARTLECAHADQRCEQPVSASVNREVGNYDGAGNETVVIMGRHRCIGAECMAWRWSGDQVEPGSITEIAGHMREHSVGPLDAVGATSRKVRHGFCGLAGAQS